MDEMNITSAKYVAHNGENVSIEFVIDDTTMQISTAATGNRHYDEIQRQVAAGTLTIQDAD